LGEPDFTLLFLRLCVGGGDISQCCVLLKQSVQEMLHWRDSSGIWLTKHKTWGKDKLTSTGRERHK